MLLKVHQYKNSKLKYLNNNIPNKFKPASTEDIPLTEMQAYYMIACITNEEFILKNLNSGQSKYSMRVLLFHLTQDHIAKTKTTKTRPKPLLRIERQPQEQFNYLQSIDFWIICDFCSLLEKEYLTRIYNLFTDEYFIVNQFGKKRLFSEYPEKCKEFGIQIL